MNDLAGLVDVDRGTVSAAVFTDPEIFELEKERLFGRAWLFLCPASEIPSPGDYFSTYMGTDPVLVVRQRDGGVKAFLNACRHRGMRVCRADDGTAATWMCSYHGWTYGVDGSLVAVPNLHDGYRDRLDPAQWGLVEVAQVDEYKGLVFGTFDATAPSLLDHLGDVRWYLDGMIDRMPGGIAVFPGVQRFSVQANWKLAAEQFVGDSYHGAVTHTSFEMASAQIGITEEEMSLEALMAMEGRQFTSRLGHGSAFVLDTLEWTVENVLGSARLAEFYRSAKPAMVERVGAARARMAPVATIFPNFSLTSDGSWLLRVFHPTGPTEFECHAWVFVEAAAPDDVREEMRLANTRTFGPSGIVELDDLECWTLITRNLEEARQMRRHPLNYSMGLGREGPDPDYPGTVNDRFIGEAPLRGFYRRWLEFVSSESYPHVAAESPE